MDISVFYEEDRGASVFTGGEYTLCKVEIFIDKELPLREQRALVIHAVIENYCRNWVHDTVIELNDLIQDALDKLEALHE